ncbi:MAG: fumarylacetoacetase [Gemmatimonadales bacterium]
MRRAHGIFSENMNATHATTLQSWVDSANEPGIDFPIQNLPYGIFSVAGEKSAARRVGVAIGDLILDVTAAVQAGLVPRSPAAAACASQTLNTLMQLGRGDLSALRAALSDVLTLGSRSGQRAIAARESVLVPMEHATLHLPANIGDYTDFYASIYHATNVGKMFRPDNPLLPNYKYVPIGYHGRASSVVVSGTEIRRPRGQTKAADAESPAFGPSRMLDYESELGLFIGRGNDIGASVSIGEAEGHVFGYCLVNDWSARDIQSWEYQPLGPFLAKNFATTISPWVVTREAVEPYRTAAFERPEGDPAPLEYLSSKENECSGGLDAILEVHVSSRAMRDRKLPSLLLSRTPFSSMYWTMAQMLTHHASNGCNLRTGDLIASGTVSGPTTDQMGCLLEITRRGALPITLPTGEVRKFLEDGDEVIMTGFLQAEGRPRLGFGECRGTILDSG